ncbi:MAG: SAM-dependent chlorinase/fluorinase [Cyclobacteriaceae bacterium]
MAVVTFMSDYGLKDHYVAAVKGVLMSHGPEIPIIDISHQITPFDLSHAAHVLSNAYKHFPSGTVHLVSIDTADRMRNRLIATQIDGQYFLGLDSGLFSLISPNEPKEVVEIPSTASTFLARDVLAEVAVKIAKGTPLQEIGTTIDDDRKLLTRQPKVTKREIVGNVIRVDSYGNLISNIDKGDFERMMELNHQPEFLIQFGREKYYQFHQGFEEADPGDCYVLFNSDNKLQIGINKGNAAELLGLWTDSTIYIEFNPE